MRRQETHDETIARLWNEMEDERIAALELQYAPRPVVIEPKNLPNPDPWRLVGSDTY